MLHRAQGRVSCQGRGEGPWLWTQGSPWASLTTPRQSGLSSQEAAGNERTHRTTLCMTVVLRSLRDKWGPLLSINYPTGLISRGTFPQPYLPPPPPSRASSSPTSSPRTRQAATRSLQESLKIKCQIYIFHCLEVGLNQRQMLWHKNLMIRVKTGGKEEDSIKKTSREDSH